MTLSRGEHDVLWETEDYIMVNNASELGYDIVNRHTGQIEYQAEQEPQGVMGIQFLQDAYTEMMKDPEREFKLRKERESNGPRLQSASPKLVQ